MAIRDAAHLSFNALSTRQSSCVECQDGSPTCPTCSHGQECQVSVPLDCTSCPKAYCTASSSSTALVKPGSKTSSGAIAGAVIGGVILVVSVVTAVYFVWKHKIKNKRGEIPSAWHGVEYAESHQEKDYLSRRTTDQTSAGRNSIASTVLTRASNVIQIAYIPGVTNRATPTLPSRLVPPVPPSPTATNGSQTGTPTDDQHFFVPGDLRDSVYSGVSGISDRTSFARTSYAARSSVASTIYGKAGVVMTPAQTGMRARAAMVSVKSMGGGSSGESSPPPLPSIHQLKFGNQEPTSPSESTFSIGSTFMNKASNANTATAARAQVVRVGSNLKQTTLSTETVEEQTEEEEAEQRSGRRTPVTRPLPREEESPFRDPPEDLNRSSSQILTAIIEDATKRASRLPSRADRAQSPFGDEHETKDEK